MTLIRKRQRKTQSQDQTAATVRRARELAEKHEANPLGGRGRWVLREDGNWYEGGAEPEQLRPDLARLPGELVTKDPSSPDQVHELDPPHIVEDLEYQHEKREAEAQKPKTAEETVSEFYAPIGEVVPLTQKRVDLVRFRIIQALIDTMLYGRNDDDPMEVRHVWFPNDNVNEYELRRGLPPADSERPRYLRYISIELDILNVPQSIRDLLQDKGVEMPDHRARYEERRAAQRMAAEASEVAPETGSK